MSSQASTDIGGGSSSNMEDMLSQLPRSATGLNTSTSSSLNAECGSQNNSLLLSSFSSFTSSQGQVTPQQTPVKNKVLQQLRDSQSQGLKSPMLQIPSTPVMERLGYGTGVGVFLLQRSPRPNCVRSPWAIKKTVKVPEDNEIFAARLQYEAGILKQLSHPNIIGYRAFGISSPDKAFLAMEKAGKSLADLIEDRVNEVLLSDDCDPEAPFPAQQIEKVALDMAKALTYLHDEVKMIHGDLKSANVLVCGDFETIKLCDFGVSRRISADGTLEGNYVGTEIWNPMEVILAKRGQNTVPVTYKADMYPFGLTLHEMITLKPPHLSSAEDSCLHDFTDTDTNETETDDTIEISFDEEAYEKALARHVGTRPLLPEIDFDDSYNTVLGVFYCCTEEDPTKRPDAKVIVQALTVNCDK